MRTRLLAVYSTTCTYVHTYHSISTANPRNRTLPLLSPVLSRPVASLGHSVLQMTSRKSSGHRSSLGPFVHFPRSYLLLHPRSSGTFRLFLSLLLLLSFHVVRVSPYPFACLTLARKLGESLELDQSSNSRNLQQRGDLRWICFQALSG